MGLGLICVGISMVVGIFVGEVLGSGVVKLRELGVVQKWREGLVLVGFWLVGRG